MLFIQPCVNPRSQTFLVKSFIYAAFPTAIGFLAGYLREKNSAPVRIIDEGITPLTREGLAVEIGNLEAPRMVGISVLTINSARAFQLAGMIKGIDPGVTVVLGGIHATVMPEECLGREGVDIVVRGEGEATLSELYRLLKAGKGYGGVEGISYRLGDNIVHNPDRKLIPLEEIPPFPYDLFEKDMDKYRDFGTIITSRGCPYSCIYCSQRSISGNMYRFLPNERVIGELRLLIDKYHQKTIWFNEDNFGVSRKRLISLCNAIIKSGLHRKAEFIGELRGDAVDYGVLKKLREANFTMLSFGAETTSDRLLRVLNKNESVEDNIRAIRMTSEMGMKASTTFIFGIPTETRAERLKTMKDAMKLPLDNVRFNTAIPYPGTRLYEIAKEEGRLNKKEDWSNFNVQYYVMSDGVPYVPRGVREELLIYDTLRANLMFYLTWHGIRSLVKSPLSGGGVITLPERWYLKPGTMMNMAGLVFFILRRLAFVSMRAFLIETHDALRSVFRPGRGQRPQPGQASS